VHLCIHSPISKADNDGLTGTVSAELSKMTDMEGVPLPLREQIEWNIPELPPSLASCMLCEFSRIRFLFFDFSPLMPLIILRPISIVHSMPTAKSDFTDYEEINCFEDTPSGDSLGCDLTSNCASSGNTGNAD
jgi:hypothetical protein